MNWIETIKGFELRAGELKFFLDTEGDGFILTYKEQHWNVKTKEEAGPIIKQIMIDRILFYNKKIGEIECELTTDYWKNIFQKWTDFKLGDFVRRIRWDGYAFGRVVDIHTESIIPYKVEIVVDWGHYKQGYLHCDICEELERL